MADDTLELKVGELTAERDLLNGEVTRLKSELAEIKVAIAGHPTALSAAKDEAAKLATNQAADILALCAKAGKVDLASKFIAERATVGTVQTALFDLLLLSNKPVGEGGAGDLGGAGDENSKYKAEYAKDKQIYLAAGVTEDDFVAMRRVDDRIDTLTTKKAA